MFNKLSGISDAKKPFSTAHPRPNVEYAFCALQRCVLTDVRTTTMPIHNASLISKCVSGSMDIFRILRVLRNRDPGSNIDSSVYCASLTDDTQMQPESTWGLHYMWASIERTQCRDVAVLDRRY
jgi:hypothetical protein